MTLVDFFLEDEFKRPVHIGPPGTLCNNITISCDIQQVSNIVPNPCDTLLLALFALVVVAFVDDDVFVVVVDAVVEVVQVSWRECRGKE